ncbi:DJ-1/PfpI family protein [Bacillus sp. CGMCC 1.16607]|uniref:DJ-1/PfpI family protein n=1 Tax=Bacillus sp. CGMCC 1.16607 TaxID=3351842 RepID=UPI0036333483
MKNKKTAVLLYPLFSEYELSVALSILMQGNKEIVTVGVDHQPVKGESGLTCLPDMSVDEVNVEEIDSLLLPGCMDVGILIDEQKWFDFIKEVTNEDTIVASISSSPFLLAKAGVLKGKKYTVGLPEEALAELGIFEIEHYCKDAVVQDGNFITARGSGFIQFGKLFGEALGLEFDMNWYKPRNNPSF